MAKKRISLDDLPKELRIEEGADVDLKEGDADRDFGWDDDRATRVLEDNRRKLSELQDKLYADRRFGMLIVLQGIDGGGKDGTCRHVISAFNPQGCTVTSFKAPSTE